MPPTQLFKFGKALLPCALLTRTGIVLIFGALISASSWRWGTGRVFEIFLEMKNRFEQKNTTTFIDSPWAIFDLNMRIGKFSIMCHLSRGHGKKALLKQFFSKRPSPNCSNKMATEKQQQSQTATLVVKFIAFGDGHLFKMGEIYAYHASSPYDTYVS